MALLEVEIGLPCFEHILNPPPQAIEACDDLRRKRRFKEVCDEDTPAHQCEEFGRGVVPMGLRFGFSTPEVCGLLRYWKGNDAEGDMRSLFKIDDLVDRSMGSKVSE